MSSTFALKFSVASVLGLLLVVSAIHSWQRTRESAPPQFDFGGQVSVVSIRAASGKYLEVHPEDGVIRATATSPGPATRFRVHVLSTATVSALKLAAAAMAPWSDASGSLHTLSGCACSGFSNEHGFGRYCHPWEDSMQAPWCYVGAECKGGTLGSFSRRHDDCALLGTSSPDWNASSAASTEYSGDPSADYPMESQAADGQAQPMMQPRYVAPRGCPCSGVRSALGYGGRCKGWALQQHFQLA